LPVIKAINVETRNTLVVAGYVFQFLRAHDISQVCEPVGCPFLYEILTSMRAGPPVRLHHRRGRRSALGVVRADRCFDRGLKRQLAS